MKTTPSCAKSWTGEGVDFAELAALIKAWGAQLGFAHTGIADVDLREAETRLTAWLRRRFHGEMEWMARHGVKRSRPAALVAGTIRVISVRMEYLPQAMEAATAALANPRLGYVARYALGRDYHKVMRRKLQQLATRIEDEAGAFGYRAFCDSAPVLERALAVRAGHGWFGKHSNLLNREGSWFFLGELYTDLPLPADDAGDDSAAADKTYGAHCGSCTRCIDICPTGAIVAPYQVDARRCISYLTIELGGVIPVQYRRAIGNRIFGCDDCQLVCPWNRYARVGDADFAPRHGLEAGDLVELFAWEESEFLRYTEGSAIRRLGHIRWLRNIAVALGNAPSAPEVTAALHRRRAHRSELVREHVAWALAEHGAT